MPRNQITINTAEASISGGDKNSRSPTMQRN